jgi:hypothetical protein
MQVRVEQSGEGIGERMKDEREEQTHKLDYWKTEK